MGTHEEICNYIFYYRSENFLNLGYVRFFPDRVCSCWAIINADHVTAASKFPYSDSMPALQEVTIYELEKH